MDIFLVNQDNPHSISLMLKLAEQSKPGAIIPLTTEEMDLWRSDDFAHIVYGKSDENPKIAEVKAGSKYIFVCDHKVNLDDVLRTSKNLGIESDIIRIVP